MNGLYPVALRLAGKVCVVVGGGGVALRRVGGLLEAGARVRVAAPVLSAGLEALAAGNALELLRQPFGPECLDGAFLAIAATDSADVNAEVARACAQRGVLFSDAGESGRGDFVIPAVLRRGALLIAVTTSGCSPSLAARIRDELAARYGPEYADLAEILGEARQRALSTGVPDRGRLTQLAGDDSLLELIREGRAEEARAKAISCISSPLE